MDRRHCLKALGVLPLVSSVPVEAARLDVPPEPTADEAAARLNRNLRAFVQLRRDQGIEMLRDERELMLLEAVCHRFCRNLRNWELTSPYWPGQDNRQFDRVRFDVMDGPVCPVFHPEAGWIPVQATVRKLRCPGFPALRSVFDDLRAFHGIDVETEMCAILAEQAVHDVQMELRKYAAADMLPRLCAIYMPPSPTVSLLPPGDWSTHRGLLLRYALKP